MLAEEIILKPIITEKSIIDVEEGKYTFKVNTKATKIQIAKAIEELFNVKILSVNTMNYDGKIKGYRGRKGKTSKFKKAIITIDLNPKEDEYLVEKGKTKKTLRKYNTEIEGFSGV